MNAAELDPLGPFDDFEIPADFLDEPLTDEEAAYWEARASNTALVVGVALLLVVMLS